MQEIIYDLLERFYATFIYEDRWSFFVQGILMTLILTIGSFLLGSLIGAGFCALRFTKNKTIKKVLDFINSFLVMIPTLVLLMLFVYLIFQDAGLSTVLVCIFGLTLKTSSYLCDIFYSSVSAVNPGEIEAARALGMTKAQAFINVTLPQAVQNALALYKNEFITCLQETSIVGTLAVNDLTKMSSIITSRTLDALFSLICVSIIYILIGVVGTKVIGEIGKEKHLEEVTK